MGIFFPENVGQQIVSTIVLLDKALQCWPRKAVRMRGNTSSFLFFVVNHITTISAKSVGSGKAWAAQITQLHTIRGSKLSAISCFRCIFNSHLQYQCMFHELTATSFPLPYQNETNTQGRWVKVCKDLEPKDKDGHNFTPNLLHTA